mmetsp:Transcript_24267/g.50773  ORF Transcript_24267/g.50773 Transcript_24267/m.50773 type:complete len:283 (+) Transcript_24267:3-851(+)
MMMTTNMILLVLPRQLPLLLLHPPLLQLLAVLLLPTPLENVPHPSLLPRLLHRPLDHSVLHQILHLEGISRDGTRSPVRLGEDEPAQYGGSFEGVAFGVDDRIGHEGVGDGAEEVGGDAGGTAVAVAVGESMIGGGRGLAVVIVGHGVIVATAGIGDGIEVVVLAFSVSMMMMPSLGTLVAAVKAVVHVILGIVIGRERQQLIPLLVLVRQVRRIGARGAGARRGRGRGVRVLRYVFLVRVVVVAVAAALLFRVAAAVRMNVRLRRRPIGRFPDQLAVLGGR